MLPPRPAATLLSLVGALLFAAPVAGQSVLWRSADELLSPEQERRLAVARQEQGAGEVLVVRLDRAALAVGAAVRLPLPDGGSATLDVLAAGPSSETRTSWSGQGGERGVGAATRAVLVAGAAGVTGAVWHQGLAYDVRPLGEDLHAVIRLRPEALLDHGAGYDAFEASQAKRMAAAPSTPPSPASGGGDVIDVLVAYTSDLLGATADPQAFAQAAVDAMNAAMSNSETAPRYALVHAYETATPSAGVSSSDLYALTDPLDGRFDEAHALREAYAADVVALLGPSSEVYGSCGIGFLDSDAALAFSVTAYTCAIGNLTFAHEVGHNMGCHHNVESTSFPRSGPTRTAALSSRLRTSTPGAR